MTKIKTMRIDYIVCPDEFEYKIESKHNVTLREVRQVLLSHPRIRFAEKGYTKGNDVYVAFGQTYGGRYLAVYFVYKPETSTAIINKFTQYDIEGAKNIWKKIRGLAAYPKQILWKKLENFGIHMILQILILTVPMLLLIFHVQFRLK